MAPFYTWEETIMKNTSRAKTIWRRRIFNSINVNVNVISLENLKQTILAVENAQIKGRIQMT